MSQQPFDEAGPSTSSAAIRQQQQQDSRLGKEDKNCFLLLITGQIETVELISIPNIYCKYCFVYGPDWRQVGGMEEGPQIVLSFYGQDHFGNDVIRGYTSTHLPTTPGNVKRKCPIFLPQATTNIQRIIGLLTGRRAEFVDPTIIAKSEGRDGELNFFDD
uniref:B9 domain-containing protein 1 n=1 Tax=Meloidogyne hapla TaxID=6305 RepID=A0A1I8BLB9_MELHA